MEDIRRLLKRPNLRFKTIHELACEYGNNWMDLLTVWEPKEALTTMSYYAGKIFYNSLVNSCDKVLLTYGPTRLYVVEKMLTCKALPKYDIRGNVLKVGNIVRILPVSYNIQERSLTFESLRNYSNSFVRVLKVNNPSAYLDDHNVGLDKDKIDHLCVATELKRNTPYEGFGFLFKDKVLRAFEVTSKLILATEDERKEYYKQLRNNNN